MLMAAKQRKPVSALSRDGLALSSAAGSWWGGGIGFQLSAG
jgi:hypothetical protein